VGGAQKRLPIHLVDEYCSTELVSTSHPTSSKLLFNWKTQRYEPWFDSNLGIEFAVYKEFGECGRIGCAGCGSWETEYVTSCMSQHAWYDLIHMRQLYEQRTQEWSALKAQLENRSNSVNAVLKELFQQQAVYRSY